ncbi:hypothetical protein BH24ACT5_BH24ACT5_11070 [soil metagenome]
MKHPLNDVVVLLPGIMGSSLRDASGQEVWGTSMGTLVKGVLTRGRAIKRLQLPDDIGDEPAPDGVTASDLLDDIHVIPGIWSVSIGYERQLRWFRDTFDVVDHDDDPARPRNFVRFPYDWRLSNRASAKALQAHVEPVLERFRAQPDQADAKIVFIAHSMGGLVARYYTDVLGGHELTRKVVTLGTPHRGAANALESLANGVSKGVGPLKVDLTKLARSLPGLYQLLPEYACIESSDGLRKTTEVAVPELPAAHVADAMRFHEQLRAGAEQHGSAFAVHPLMARTQPTATTARIVDGTVQLVRTIEDRNEGGDGTVPRLSAAPYGVLGSSPTIRYVMDQHGALPANEPTLVELEGVLTASDVVVRGAEVDIGVSCEEIVMAGEPLDVAIDAEPDLVVDVVVHHDDGTTGARTMGVAHGDGTYRATIADLAPGRYVVRVAVRGTSGVVAKPIVVLPDEVDCDE